MGSAMQKEQYLYDDVYVISQFLSPDECRKYIAIAEEVGFVDAPITTANGPVMRKDVRNNLRVMIDDPQEAALLWESAKKWAVSPFRGREAIGLNERFRYYRYEPGQSFAPHYDGAYERENGERSEFTFLIYLNDDFEGGATTFFKPGRFHVVPQTGDLLIFRHPQLHEGAIVESGVKYVLRSDVMYSKYGLED